jgi:hypothetical protein
LSPRYFSERFGQPINYRTVWQVSICCVIPQLASRFKKIMPTELYCQVWTKKNKKQAAPNVVSMISNFNRFSAWIASEIVAHSDLKKRTQTLQHFINIGIVISHVWRF